LFTGLCLFTKFDEGAPETDENLLLFLVQAFNQVPVFLQSIVAHWAFRVMHVLLLVKEVVQWQPIADPLLDVPFVAG
jgi:hypothetical protein